jgi:hypothetical protein
MLGVAKCVNNHSPQTTVFKYRAPPINNRRYDVNAANFGKPAAPELMCIFP